MVTRAQDFQDGDAAAKIADLELTERFSSARLTRCLSLLQGPKAQRALIGVADRAAFLVAPKAEIPARPAPGIPEQRKIMGLAADYVTHALKELPHFYATRTVTHFESAAANAQAAANGQAAANAQGAAAGQGPAIAQGGAWDAKSGESAIHLEAADFGALHAVKLSRAVVRYRDGEEVVDASAVKVNKSGGAEQGLHSWGVFGPIVSLVLLDAAQNHLAWSHWEQGATGPVAVFRYSVPREKSHYQVQYCCVVSKYGFESKPFQQMTGYHGEIGIDPATGTIERLQLQADLESEDPMSHADLVVEYGTVELGGKPYICPVRSVSISVAPTLRRVQDIGGRVYPAMGPPQMLLNDVGFGQYHLFLGETRVLSADEERTARMAPDATLAATTEADAQPSEEILADAPAGSDAPSAGGASEVDAPEITATSAAPLPDTEGHAADEPSDQQQPGYTFHLNARLVDVSVVALDKKGHPISGLKHDDFEVYDNGVKQEVRSFNQADAEGDAAPAETSARATSAAETFSNRGDKASAAKAGAEGNTFVFVVDPANLVYNDLVDARRQMLDFLKKLEGKERVALYVMRYRGFQVLQEATTDHAQLAAVLTKWMPTAQDLLNARDEEDRNRQKFETVHSPEDLLSVNGSYTLDPESQQVALDPKLREMGSNPGPNALDVLVDVARHLSPIAGHKSLIWVTSDNALADWNRMSVSVEKHSKYIEPIALRTQEAMNNAHVSVYPLDASRLEANVITADTGRRNVELTPTFQMPAGVELEMEGTEMQAGRDANAFGQGRDLRPGRLTSQMQQDERPIEGVFREVAEATGGHAFRRSSNIEGELNGVVAESHATYLLGFSPAQPADGKYHVLTVKLVGHRDATVRYRTGFQYDKEPSTLKERFAQAVWQPTDAKEIAISAQPVTDAAGQALRVTVAGTDLDLSQQELAQNAAGSKRKIWSGKLDIFVVERDDSGRRAHVTGRTVGLHLKPVTYQHAISDGLTFDQRVQLGAKSAVASLRVVVVDVNSGRIGSVTVPSSALGLHTN
jgi:VWFA-related protein